MSTIPVFVGLDYHQSSIQACVVDVEGRVVANRRCRSEVAHVLEVTARCGAVQRAAIESCSGAAEFAEALVGETGWSIDLCHPGYAKRMKTSPDKSDMSDAHLLADLTRVGYLPRVWLAPRSIREIRCVTRHRHALAGQRRGVKLRVRAVLREQRVKGPASPWTGVWMAWLRETEALSEQARWVVDRLLEQLDWLQRQLDETERRLEEITRDDAVVQRLRTLRGIGPVTAWTIRAEIGRFDRFTSGKQLSRFCGLSPRNASSGERQADAGLIKAGNAQLRAVLIEAAHRLARHDPHWMNLAQRLRSKGKKGSVVAAAVANRWVRRLFHEMTEERPMTA